MLLDPALQRLNWTRRTEPADLPELMDEPCSYEELRSCLIDLGQVNQLSQGYRPTLRFLDRLQARLQDRLVARQSAPSMLRILDVGCGGGDTLRVISRWAKSRKLIVELTGMDLNPLAVRAARETPGGDSITWLCGDALAYTGESDVILSSLVTHHLSTQQVIRFMQWMEQRARLGWFVNDLERSKRSAHLFSLLASFMRWHSFVQHDGPVSFARGFVPTDWRQMLASGSLAPGAAEITRAFPSRLCVSRFK